MGVLSYAEELLYFVIEWGILLLELFGVIILAYTSISCFVKWIRKEQNIRLELAQGITLALSFKMGGEVLRTALTVLLHWEIKNEKQDLENLEEVCDECGHVHKKDEKQTETA